MTFCGVFFALSTVVFQTTAPNYFIYQERDHSYRVFALSTKVVVCVFKESDHGFVGSDQKGFKCLTCKFNVHNCCHVTCIKEKLGQDDQDLPDVVYEMQCSAISQRKVESKPRCLSDTPISFHPPPYIQRVLCSSFYSSLPQFEGNLLLSPELRGSVCPECGSPWSQLNPTVESWSDGQILLFTINKVYPCTGKCVSNSHVQISNVFKFLSIHCAVFYDFKIAQP